MRITAQGTLPHKPNIAIVVSPYYREITEKLEQGAVQCLKKHDLSPVVTVEVPGAFEIPLAVRQLLRRGDVDAVVALGLVIQGETPHFDYVCQAAERGCSQLQLEFGKPVGFGILTTLTMDQAEARSGGSKGNKGLETCEVVLQMLEVLKKISS